MTTMSKDQLSSLKEEFRIADAENFPAQNKEETIKALSTWFQALEESVPLFQEKKKKRKRHTSTGQGLFL